MNTPPVVSRQEWEAAPTSPTAAATRRLGGTWSYLDMAALGRQEEWEDSPAGYLQTSPYEWWVWHDEPGRANPEQVERARRAAAGD